MIKIKLPVPSEEFGSIEQVFEFKDYLSMNEIFEIGLPTELINAGLVDMKGFIEEEDVKEIFKKVDPNTVFKYQLKLLNLLYIDKSLDLGTLPMPVIIELMKNPKLVKAVQYSFGQGITIKTDDIKTDPKKN